MLAWKPKSDDSTVASVRYRCLIPLRELTARGAAITLFNANKVDDYGAVLFSKSYDESDQDLARRLKARGGRVVLDLCDNHFYNPFKLPAYEKARTDLLEMIRLADLVVCSTPTLAETVAKEARLPRLPEVVGDPVEFDDVHLQPRAGSWSEKIFPWTKADKQRRLMWFGIHASPNAPCGMADVCFIAPTLAAIHNEFPFELVICSNSRKLYQERIPPMGIPSSYVEYDIDTFPQLLRKMDGVILPIYLNPFTLAKSHNRLTTALHAGVPVAADGIPSYQEFGAFCVLDDWARGLREILGAPGKAKQKALAGKKYIEQRWTPARVADRWQEVLKPYLEPRAPSAA